MELAPIAIFCYSRPKHLFNLLTSLVQNEESKNSDVFIFVDGVRSSKDIIKQNEVKEILNLNWEFKSKNIVLRDKNYGLKKNIIEGVSEVISKYRKIIVLEDDLEVSNTFLNYMNNSLIMYEEIDEVWHVSGYSLPKLIKNKKKAFLSVEMNCWGWGTWYKNWNEIHNNLENKISNLNKAHQKKFNFYGLNKNNINQIILNENNKIDTWAIFWYQTIFVNKGLTLNPVNSLVRNAGFDGSGQHKSSNKFYNINKLNNYKVNKFPRKNNISFLYENLLKIKYIIKNFKNYINYHSKKLFKN